MYKLNLRTAVVSSLALPPVKSGNRQYGARALKAAAGMDLMRRPLPSRTIDRGLVR